MAAPARGPTKGLRAGLAVMIWALAATAWAQSSDRPYHKPLLRRPPSSASNVTGDANVTGDNDVVPSSQPVKPTGGAKATAPLRPRITAPVLRSAVRSRYSRPAIVSSTTSGQCRARCALDRSQCASADVPDTSGCDPGWTRCLSTCEGLTYGRGP